MPETTAEAAFFVSERARERISASPAEFGDERITTTISLGISAYEKEDLGKAGAVRGGLERFIDQADQALYESKNSGRNRTTLFVAQNSRSGD
jgi:diguanylate cyclase (GGDEF)-like protein